MLLKHQIEELDEVDKELLNKLDALTSEVKQLKEVFKSVMLLFLADRIRIPENVIDK